MFKKYLLISIVFLVNACTAKPTTIPIHVADQIDDEEQAVYAYLLSSLYTHTGYVIMETTATSASGVDDTSQTLDYVMQNMHAVDANTIASFEDRNDTAYPVRSDMQLAGPYTLLTQVQKNQIFSLNQSGWDIFYSRYPQAPGITTFSRVGFNVNLDQALVYMGTNSNWLIGSGYYVLLNRVSGNWSIDQKVLIWTS